MLIKLLKAELKLRNIRNGRNNTVKETSSLISRLMYESARQYFPSIAHILLAGFDKQGTHLYELYADGSLNEVKDYVSSGSGSPMVYGILENSFKDSVSVKDAEDLAVKAISASMQRDSFSGNGIDVMVISRDSIRKTVQKKVSGIPV